MLVDHPLWDAHGTARLQQLLQEDTAPVTASQCAQRAEELVKDADALLLLSIEFKTRANRLAPISQLPPEIFLRITRFVVEAWRPSSRDLGWVRMTHVCRFWRNLLMGEHTLWANEIGIIPRASRRFLKRSGANAPLHLYGIVGHARLGDFFLPLKQLPLQRVHTWHCFLPNHLTLASFTKLLYKNSLPSLRDLVTDYNGTSVRHTNKIGNAPVLTSWRSKRVFFTVIAPLLVNLDLSAVHVTATELLCLFSRSPLLRSFIGSRISFDEDDGSDTSCLKVDLPSLQKLSLGVFRISAHDLYERFIAHIAHPTSTEVTLNITQDIGSSADFDILIYYLCMPSQEDLRWRMEIRNGSVFLTGSSVVSPSHHGTRTIGLANQTLGTLVPHLRNGSEDLSLALGNIQYLDLDGPSTGPIQTTGDERMAELCMALSGLRALRILSWGWSHRHDILVALPKYHTASTEHLLPHLQSWRVSLDILGSVGVEELVKWLEPRIGAGMGPHTLLVDCTEGHARPDFDSRLLALVPDVRYIDPRDCDSRKRWQLV
ncbi:unnamed protein product [Peniophora sp. CBMAI 1063]|nr:unnamed protein product [Peniophora sp. CBMAI 1063]